MVWGLCGIGERKSYVTDSGVWDGREKVTHVCVCGAGKMYHHGCDGCNLCIDAAVLP